jgi:NAD-dependent DNA ligase
MKYELRLAAAIPEVTKSMLFQSRDGYRHLLNICEGLLADGEVNAAEATYLKDWIGRHPEHHRNWPFPDLIARLDQIFEDGVVSQQECEELADILRSLIGTKIVHTDARLAGAGMPSPTRLIFDNPAPEATFDRKEFCVTGVFTYGRRGVVEKAIESRGGLTIKAPRSTTQYVLVGSFVSPGWANGNFGTKIERALSLRKGGAAIAIIEEDHWKAFLK